MKRTYYGSCSALLAALGMTLWPCGAEGARRPKKTAEVAVGTGNPYMPLWEHVPDGEPRVFEDPDRPGHYRVYVVGSHDTRFDGYCGADIRMWSAPVEDLTDWRDEGPVFTYHTQGQWDVMYAPDLVEVKRPDGTKEYYLYPHSRGHRREAMVCKGSRPDGPFEPINLTADGTATVPGSFLGFDPSVFVDEVTDPADPDHGKGFRAYGFWGFQRSSAAELDQNTMYSVRPGTEQIPYFIPASNRYGQLRDPEGTPYPALYSGQDPKDFNFFEASSIRKVGNKYVMIFSGYSGPDYGLGSSNSTLRYAYGDSPLGPWRSGGVLVDSRGVVPSRDGSRLQTTNAGHNTHGSIEQINGQWYVFYHRPPRAFGFARQAMVAPISIQYDETPVAQGGKVVIRGYDPYAPDHVWQAAASNGNVYTGAEVTSEGFQLFGLPPYRYYSAGYACYLSNMGSMQDAWDVWDNHMSVYMNGGDIVGFKYFGFGGLDKAQLGLKPFAGTRKGNGTLFNLFVVPGSQAFTMEVWMDGPWDNATWKGRKLGEIAVAAGAPGQVAQYTLDVSAVVDGLGGKHAIYLVARGQDKGRLCTLQGLGFSTPRRALRCPEVPVVQVWADGQPVALPATPVRSTNANGITDYCQYEVDYALPQGTTRVPVFSASCTHRDVTVRVKQPAGLNGQAVVECSYKGMPKTYTIRLQR